MNSEGTMPSTNFAETWQAYQSAMQDLYRVPPEESARARRAGAAIQAESVQAGVDALVTRSSEVRQSLQPAIESPDPEQRELAGLKLLAVAAHDLSLAAQLVEPDSRPARRTRAAAPSSLLASNELREILDAPLETGLQPLVKVRRAAIPADPQVARVQLEKTIQTFLIDVPDRASGIGQKAISGLLVLGIAPLQGAASLAAQEILGRVPDKVSVVTRRAAELAVEALQKLRSAWGEQQEKTAREQVAAWVEDIQEKRDTLDALLDKLYETPRIGQEARDLLAAAPEDLPVERINEATQALESLVNRYGKTKTTLEVLLGALAFGKAPLMAAVPWGPLALYAVYAGVTGYAIYTAGDYLDWYRTGENDWLNRVKGLRMTVGGLATAPSVDREVL